MSNKVEVKGTIDKVVRQNGKPGAQVVVTIPANLATAIPMGGVVITIEPNQTALNLSPVKRGAGGRTAIRGDKS